MPLVCRLAVLAALLVAAAAWSGSALAADIPPVNDVAPRLSDYRPRIGETLTVTTGTWHDVDTGGINLPLTYSYRWYSCGALVGTNSSSYTLTQSDAYCTVQAYVTATDTIGGVDQSATAVSNITNAIFPHTIVTDHFTVSYYSDRNTAGAITDDQAGQIASLAEQAYTAETALGYTIPGDGALGGDSRIDIHVVPISGAGVLGDTVNDTSSSPTTSYIELNASDPTDAFALDVVAHELFHVIQLSIWFPSSASDYWLLEASAEWLGFKTAGYPSQSLQDLNGDWSMALDCRNTLAETPCDLVDDYKGNGYSRWPFFEYLYERYGADAITGIFQQGASGGAPATAALSRELGAKNGSLTDFFTDWAVANATGGYQVAELQTLKPAIYGSPIEAGTLTRLNLTTAPGSPKVTSGPIPTISVPVNHLGVRYVEIDRGDPKEPDTPCYAATLKLNVTVPSGSGAKPYFWWSQKTKDGTNLQPAQAMSIADGVASITVPWDTCQWDSTPGYVVLANPSTTLDGATFTISGTLSVDTNTEATPTAPPDPVKLHGSDVSVPSAGGSSADGVPQVAVFGPEVLQLASSAKQIRLIVSSDGSGQLKAALGGVVLGTLPIRAGGNDLRFPLPTKLLQGLHKPAKAKAGKQAKTARAASRTAAAPSVLTLTPLSTAGAAGASITRRVVVH